jgi:hypothetical protein
VSYLGQAVVRSGALKIIGVPPAGLLMHALVKVTGDLEICVQGGGSFAGVILPSLRDLEGGLKVNYGGMRGKTDHRPFVLPSLVGVRGAIALNNYKAGTRPGDAVLPSLTFAGSIVYEGGSYSIDKKASSTPFPMLSTVDNSVMISDLQAGTCIGDLFPMLRLVRGDLTIQTINTACLRGLDPVFPILDVVGGTINIKDVTGSPNLPSMMPALRSIGGIFIEGGSFSGI